MRRTLAALATGLAGALVATVVVVAVPASGSAGDPLALSQVNQAGPMTVLKSNGGFRILAKNPKRPPLMVYTPDSMPPLQVSSKAKVTNLNADLLDGLDATAFVRGTDLVAAYAGGSQSKVLTSTPEVVRSVSLTAGTGTVIVTSTAVVGTPNPGDGVACWLTTGTDLDPGYQQLWTSAGSPGEWGQLAGTRGFPVALRGSFTANLICAHVGSVSSTSSVSNSSLTAIFVPNP